MKPDRIPNGSIASKIVFNLDSQDELGADGTITKSVWEEFRASCEEGCIKNISGETISRKEAIKLIMNGLFNAAKRSMKSMGLSTKDTRKHNKELNNIAKIWLANSTPKPQEVSKPEEEQEISVNESDREVVVKPDEKETVDDEQNEEAAVDDETVDEDENTTETNSDDKIERAEERPIAPRVKPRKIHAPVTIKISPKKVTAKLPNQNETTAFSANNQAMQLSKDIENAFKNISFRHPIDSVNNLKKQLKKINKDNVVFVLNYINDLAEKIDGVDLMGFGLNNKDVFKYVLSPLMQKADKLNIRYNKLSDSALLENMVKLINELRRPLSSYDKKLIQQYKDKKNRYNKNKAEVDEFNKNIEKYEACFNHANKFLADSLNMKPKPKVTKLSDGAVIQFNNGCLINVSYDKNGIDSVYINHYPARPETAVKYTRFQAKCDLINNHSHLAVDKTKNPESGYDFGKILAFIQDLLT